MRPYTSTDRNQGWFYDVWSYAGHLLPLSQGYGSSVVLREELMDVSLDDAGFAGAQFPDD